MYGVQKCQLRNISKREYTTLRALFRLTKNMYNVGLYHVRQHFFETKKFLTYPQNNKLSKENENYKLLNTDAAQQTLKKVEEAFTSFFGLLKKGDKRARIPKYLEKEGFFELTFPRIKIQKDGSFFSSDVSCF